MSIFEKLKNCNVLCQGSETLIALAPTNISTGFKAEFYKIKQKFVIEYAYLSVLYYAFLHKNKKREEKHMEKMILADKTELEIQAGGSLGANVVVVPDFADLKTVAEALTKEGNLKTVQYKTDEQVTGEYTDMKLETPLFKTVDYTKEKR